MEAAREKSTGLRLGGGARRKWRGGGEQEKEKVWKALVDVYPLKLEEQSSRQLPAILKTSGKCIRPRDFLYPVEFTRH
jgi:hypothetical protein